MLRKVRFWHLVTPLSSADPFLVFDAPAAKKDSLTARTSPSPTPEPLHAVSSSSPTLTRASPREEKHAHKERREKRSGRTGDDQGKQEKEKKSKEQAKETEKPKEPEKVKELPLASILKDKSKDAQSKDSSSRDKSGSEDNMSARTTNSSSGGDKYSGEERQAPKHLRIPRLTRLCIRAFREGRIF